MANYSIKQLGEISGIQPHTIRIWEQRYNLFEPNRTDTNIRYYDDAQLKKLLNVTDLLKSGMKISKISLLSDEERTKKLDKIIENIKPEDGLYELLGNKLLLAISVYDCVQFDDVFKNAVEKFGLEITYFKIVYPLLVRIGLMWIKNDIIPAQEHFLSSVITQKFYSSINAIPPVSHSDQTWILFLGEREEHEIGLLLAYYLLRKYQKKVIYLGANVPYENLKNVVDNMKPTHLYTFIVKNQPVDNVNKFLNRLKTDFGQTNIYISGNQIVLNDCERPEKINWIQSIEALITLIA